MLSPTVEAGCVKIVILHHLLCADVFAQDENHLYIRSGQGARACAWPQSFLASSLHANYCKGGLFRCWDPVEQQVDMTRLTLFSSLVTGSVSCMQCLTAQTMSGYTGHNQISLFTGAVRVCRLVYRLCDKRQTANLIIYFYLFIHSFI